MRWLIAHAVAGAFFFVGCNQDSLPKEGQHDPVPEPFVGCWHMFVPIEENGPHHEYYEIRAGNSVTACFLAVDDTLIARFHGRLEGNVIVSENGKLRLSLKRDGESLIIRDKNERVFTSIEMMPANCKEAPEGNGTPRKTPVISLTAAAQAQIQALAASPTSGSLRCAAVQPDLCTTSNSTTSSIQTGTTSMNRTALQLLSTG